MAAGLTCDIKCQVVKLSFDSAAEIAEEISINVSQSGFIQKVESQIQEHFWGENKFVQEHFRRVIRTFYLQYSTINRAISFR